MVINTMIFHIGHAFEGNFIIYILPEYLLIADAGRVGDGARLSPLAGAFSS